MSGNFERCDSVKRQGWQPQPWANTQEALEFTYGPNIADQPGVRKDIKKEQMQIWDLDLRI